MIVEKQFLNQLAWLAIVALETIQLVKLIIWGKNLEKQLGIVLMPRLYYNSMVAVNNIVTEIILDTGCACLLIFIREAHKLGLYV